jgi:hypothetical protein
MSNDSESIRFLHKLEGMTIKGNVDGKVYLVLDQKLCRLTTQYVLDSLIKLDPTGVKSLPQGMIDEMPKGEEFGEPTWLIEGDEGIFLVSNGKKRHVRDSEAMVRYAFNWGRVVKVGGELKMYETGADIRWIDGKRS